MKNDLLMYVEETLNNEANRIVKCIVEKYEKGVKVNKTFGSLVRELMDKKLWFYRTDIEIRTICNLPNGLEPDPHSEYALVTSFEDNYIYLKKYSNYIISNNFEKNPQLASLRLANIIIDLDNKHTLFKYNLIELIADNMKNIYSCEYDSIDARAIMLYLPESLSELGYKITNTDPLQIKAIN